MGAQKFYESPDGRLRVELLLRSGENFGSWTLEGRLLKRHIETEATYRFTRDKWIMDRVLDLVMVAGLEKVETNSAKSYEKRYDEIKTQISDLVNPFKQMNEERLREQARKDAERERRLEEMAKTSTKGFGSLREIKESLGMVPKTEGK